MDDATCTGGCACSTTASGSSAPARRDQAPVTRRGVLAGSAAVVATLALGACASPDETSSGSPATTPEASPDASTETPASSESSQAPDPGAGEVLATTGEFPTGGGKVVTTTAAGVVVVTQPADGEFKAFSGKCPHQGCPVSEVLENEIRCNCHGSTFDATTGDRLAGPAMVGLAPVAIAVEGTDIVLA